MKTKLFLLGTLVTLGVSAQSPLPNLLKDINTGTVSSSFGALSAFPANNIVFGVTTPSSSTRGLWASDATTVNTIQLRQFNFNITGFTDYNNKKYIAGTSTGFLWRTDGTAAGTDSIPIPELTGVYSMTVCNNLLFFVATSTISGTEVWRTDGTTAGTFLVRDIAPGTTSALSLNTAFSAAYNNKVYFVANDQVSGQEIWTSDGTTSGTNLLSDIYPGSGTSQPGNFSVGNNGVYFGAYTTASGTELWFTDGTSANTQMIMDVATGTMSAMPSRLLFVNNYAYYFYGDKLFRSNGTSAGTNTLSLPIPSVGNVVSERGFNGGFMLRNNELYYAYSKVYQNGPTPATSVYDDSLYFCKFNLALSSGTVASRLLAYQTGAFTNNLLWSVVQVNNDHFVVIGGTFSLQRYICVFNAANSALRNFSIWQDPGVLDGLQVVNNKLYHPFPLGSDLEPGYLDLVNDSLYRIKDVNPNASGLSCGTSLWKQRLYQVNGYNYFIANNPAYGFELWQTDMTNAGTNLLMDINPGSGSFNGTSLPGCNSLTSLVTGNNMFFVAYNDTYGWELWCFPAVSVPTGLGVAARSAQPLRVFPNPTNQRLNISNGAAMQKIRLINALGSIVKEIMPDATEAELDLSGLPAGVYLVSVTTPHGTSTEKVIKVD